MCVDRQCAEIHFVFGTNGVGFDIIHSEVTYLLRKLRAFCGEIIWLKRNIPDWYLRIPDEMFERVIVIVFKLYFYHVIPKMY